MVKEALVGHASQKDINSFLYQMQETSLPATILDAVIFRNEKIDRPEKDWSSDKGRCCMNIKIKKINPRAKIPTQATDGDAGYDLYAVRDMVIPPFI